MARPFALALAMMVLAGCNTPQPTQNPFLGRTTVPPPATVLPGQQGAAAPYYQPPAGSYQPPAGNYQSPPAGAATATPGPGGAYIPPSGGYGMNGIERTRADSLGPDEHSVGREAIARSRPPKTGAGIAVRHAVHPDDGTIAVARTETTNRSKRNFDRAFDDDTELEYRDEAVATVAHTETSPAGDDARNNDNKRVATVSRPRTIRVEERDPSTVISDGDWVEVDEEEEASDEKVTEAPGRFKPPSSVKQVTHRTPSARHGGIAQAALTRAESRATEPREPADESQDEVATTSQPAPKVPSHLQASYGYDSAYKWIKGKLEYSARKRQWKLRYIPIDGETDSHGGSVILSDSPELDEFEPGDFIAVQGQIGDPAGDSIGFAPSYQVQRVKKLVD